MGNKASKGKNPNDLNLDIETQAGQGAKHQTEKQIQTGQNITNQSEKQIRTGLSSKHQSKKQMRTGLSSKTQSQKQIQTGLSSKTQKGGLQIPDSQQIQQLQLYKKPDQEKIGEGEYAIVY